MGKVGKLENYFTIYSNCKKQQKEAKLAQCTAVIRSTQHHHRYKFLPLLSINVILSFIAQREIMEFSSSFPLSALSLSCCGGGGGCGGAAAAHFPFYPHIPLLT